MMDRDGRLLETWGGRRGRNSSSCFYLLHTHTLVPHILLAASRVCAVSKPSLPHSHLCSCSHRHILTHFPGLCLSSGFGHVYVLGVVGCFHEGVCIYCLPSMIYLHLHLARSFAIKSSWHSVLLPLNTFCSLTAFPWLAEKSGQRNIRNPSPKDLARWIYMRHESRLSEALPSLAN